MFTGIIAATGRVLLAGGGRLEIATPDGTVGDPIAAGESIAVDGVCLTAVEPGRLLFDLAPETLRRTTLGAFAPGRRVNLERAMRPSDRFGGHIVQGHVDGVGRIVSRREDANAVVFRIEIEGGDRYLVDRGSVTVDGISLTVAHPQSGVFEVWIIPHTLAATTLADRNAGGAVNIEFDEVAKWVERLAAPYAGAA